MATVETLSGLRIGCKEKKASRNEVRQYGVLDKPNDDGPESKASLATTTKDFKGVIFRYKMLAFRLLDWLMHECLDRIW